VQHTLLVPDLLAVEGKLVLSACLTDGHTSLFLSLYLTDFDTKGILGETPREDRTL
jgi:hypothetical protein